jgi:Protein of unknown function (DUF2795)
MNFDPKQITQMLNNIQFPIDKTQLIQMARQRGMNDQVIGMMEKALPDMKFQTISDLQSRLSGMLGKLGSMGGGMGKSGDAGDMR